MNTLVSYRYTIGLVTIQSCRWFVPYNTQSYSFITRGYPSVLCILYDQAPSIGFSRFTQ